LVRPVESKTATPWLGDRKRGLALSQLAPAQLFELPTGRRATVRSPQGAFSVRMLGDAVPVGSLPLAQVRGAIAAALRQFERGERYERWTEDLQKRALNGAICARDDIPAPGAVELSTYLPSLALEG